LLIIIYFINHYMLNIISLRCDLGGEGDRAAVAGGAARTLALLSLLCARA
jgi:hypothetical protein